ncbi:MAG: alcohol dehydrogenase catalytic domain-containing protein [bacterium]|nr:alcohol dehydrogenase catalytic domain-containing protein [bacterium]
MPSIPKEMKAAVTYGPEDVKIETIPVPDYEPGLILVKVAACGICGTDIHILSGHMRPAWPPFYPFIQGHEWGGEVAAIGSGAKTDLKVGDRVIMEPTIGCGVCGMCRRGSYHLCEETGKPGGGYKLLGHSANGAFSEYGVAPPTNLHRLPASMSWKEAVIVNQVVVALHSIERGGGVQPADTVAIVGPGLLGLSVLQLVRAFGAAKTYIAGRGYRLDIARALGADVAIDVTKDDPVKVVMEDTGGRGVDLVIECAGPPEAMRNAVAMARRGGRVVLEGINGGKEVSLPSDRIVLDEITIFGGRGSPNCYPRAIQLITEGHIDAEKMLTHTFPLDRFDEAIALVKARGDGVMRAMITP